MNPPSLRYRGIAILACCLLVTFSACDETGRIQLTKPELRLQMNGGIAPGIIFDHEFQILVWHQHPGTIHNGTLTISVGGEHLKGNPYSGQNRDVWSFDSWGPNQTEAKSFYYYLDATGDEVDLTISVSATSAETKPFQQTYRWAQGRWQ